jgi:hypothetical protein
MQTIVISPRGIGSSYLNLNDKGIKSEFLVGAALKKLKNEGVISDYIKASKKDDSKGIDYWVTLVGKKRYRKMPLQVKSSSYYQEIHLKKHSDIPSVVVGNISFSKIPESLKTIILNFKQGKVIHV